MLVKTLNNIANRHQRKVYNKSSKYVSGTLFPSLPIVESKMEIGLSFACGLFAFGVFKVLKIQDWNEKILTQVIRLGTDDFRRRPHYFDTFSINENVDKEFHLNDYQVKVRLFKSPMIGIVIATNASVPNIHSALDKFFDKFTHCLLKVSNLVVLICKKQQTYYCFTPHALRSFRRVVDIHTFLTQSGWIRSDDTFCLYRIEIVHVKGREPQASEEQLNRLETSFTIVNDNLAVLCCDIHIGSSYFKESRNCQSIPACYTALVCSKITHPATWTVETMNQILLQANIAYQKHFDKTKSMEYTLEHIPSEITVGQYTVGLSVHMNVSRGKIVFEQISQFCKLLKVFFRIFTHGLIQIGSFTFAVWRKDAVMFLFDPYGNNNLDPLLENCKLGLSKGAYLQMHTDADTLYSNLEAIARKKAPNGMYLFHALTITGLANKSITKRLNSTPMSSFPFKDDTISLNGSPSSFNCSVQLPCFDESRHQPKPERVFNLDSPSLTCTQFDRSLPVPQSNQPDSRKKRKELESEEESSETSSDDDSDSSDGDGDNSEDDEASSGLSGSEKASDTESKNSQESIGTKKNKKSGQKIKGSAKSKKTPSKKDKAVAETSDDLKKTKKLKKTDNLKKTDDQLKSAHSTRKDKKQPETKQQENKKLEFAKTGSSIEKNKTKHKDKQATDPANIDPSLPNQQHLKPGQKIASDTRGGPLNALSKDNRSDADKENKTDKIGDAQHEKSELNTSAALATIPDHLDPQTEPGGALSLENSMRNLIVVGSVSGSYDSIRKLLSHALRISNRILLITKQSEWIIFRTNTGFLLLPKPALSPKMLCQLSVSLEKLNVLQFPTFDELMRHITSHSSESQGIVDAIVTEQREAVGKTTELEEPIIS